MYLDSWREQTPEGEGRSKQSKHRVSALHDILVNIKLLLVTASNYKDKVFILIHNINFSNPIASAVASINGCCCGILSPPRILFDQCVELDLDLRVSNLSNCGLTGVEPE